MGQHEPSIEPPDGKSLILGIIVVALAVLFVWWTVFSPAHGRDLDGRYAQSPLRGWFDSLRSNKGFCCSIADGRETEYDIRGDKYWVPVNGVWTEVPDDAVITEPNKFGRPMVWLRVDQQIQCFIPATGS